MNVTEEVTIHGPNVSTLLSGAFTRGELNAATRGPFIWSQISCLFFLTRCKQSSGSKPPSTRFKEAWAELKLKLLKNLFRLWGIFSPNLRNLSRKNNEPTPFIQFPAMTVTTSTSDRPNVSLVHVWKSINKRFSFTKRKIQLYRSTHAQLTIQLSGIILKLSPLIGVTHSIKSQIYAFLTRLT